MIEAISQKEMIRREIMAVDQFVSDAISTIEKGRREDAWISYNDFAWTLASKAGSLSSESASPILAHVCKETGMLFVMGRNEQAVKYLRKANAVYSHLLKCTAQNNESYQSYVLGQRSCNETLAELESPATGASKSRVYPELEAYIISQKRN